MPHVLIVDDEPSICWALSECLRDEGLTVDVAGSAEQALNLSGRTRPDVIVMDVRLPGMDGLQAMQHLRTSLNGVHVILMTAFGSLSTAVRALDGGAFDYLTKPIDLDKAVAAVRQAIGTSQTGVADSQPNPGEESLIGCSPAMQDIFRRIALVADRDVPVLITGESGTGKELVARAIHQHSGRSGPLVPVCIPSLSETVIESELFGHVRGAFTGADSDRRGLLELASNGTAFVDEIGDVPLSLQTKLLRALELREIRPVGGGTCRSAAFRLIAATNRPLEQLVAAGSFRADLYYRLNVFRIEIPPLRARSEDIPLLASSFLQRAGATAPRLRLADSTLSELTSRHWSGNARELRNALEFASVVCRGDVILPHHLPPAPAAATEPASTGHESLSDAVAAWARNHLDSQAADLPSLYDRFLSEAEPALLDAVLKSCRGNRTVAAKILGIHRETLREKLRRFGREG